MRPKERELDRQYHTLDRSSIHMGQGHTWDRETRWSDRTSWTWPPKKARPTAASISKTTKHEAEEASATPGGRTFLPCLCLCWWHQIKSKWPLLLEGAPHRRGSTSATTQSIDRWRRIDCTVSVWWPRPQPTRSNRPIGESREAHHCFHFEVAYCHQHHPTTILTPTLVPSQPQFNPTHRPWRRQAGAASTPEPCWASISSMPSSAAARPASGVGLRSALVSKYVSNPGNSGICGRQRRASGPGARSMRSIKRFSCVLDVAARTGWP